jgi:hypothetical protein
MLNQIDDEEAELINEMFKDILIDEIDEADYYEAVEEIEECKRGKYNDCDNDCDNCGFNSKTGLVLVHRVSKQK